MDYIDNFIKEISQEKNDIYLYGAGYVAANIRKILEKSHIDFCGYIVDEKYLPKDEKSRTIDGKPIISVNNLMRDSVAVMAVYRDIGDGVELKHDKIKKTYKRDFSSYIQFGAISEEFLSINLQAFNETFNKLADFESRTAMMSFITQKYQGCYEKPYSGHTQYYDTDIFIPEEDMIFLDCGAFDGDTIIGFMDFLKQNNIRSYKKCYALEPDKDNYDILKKNMTGYENIETYQLGAFNKRETLLFEEKNTVSSSISSSGSIQIEVDSIDNILKGAPVSYIKMDIEGSELKALEGARETILKHKPKIAVCVYHKAEDLITIPQFLLSLNSNYKLYLRNNAPAGVETVLYAI